MTNDLKLTNSFIVAAPHSGAGKTAITLAILAAFCRRGLQVQPFKCGPDFIDPTLHKLVTGQLSRNLDLRMCGEEFVCSCFSKFSQEADIAVVEGVMGLFDGGSGSTAALAKFLNLPVVLVVDVKGAAESIAALVKGFETLDPELTISGVILNRVGSPRHMELMEGAIRQHCRADILGYIPRDHNFAIPERHLGLHMGDEAPLSAKQIGKMADSIEEHIHMEKLLNLKISAHAKQLTRPQKPTTQKEAPPHAPTRIAVARDRAFCFLYQDNLDILVAAGAELVFFSPLDHEKLPDNISGIYLCGGYPELFAKELSNNTEMLKAIKTWSDNNGPIFAECGGFMYLCQEIVGDQKHFQPMVGIFPTKARLKKRLVGLGYRQVILKGKSLFGTKCSLHGHEFHYSDIDEMPTNIERVFRTANNQCIGYQINNTLAGYLHLHFGKTPEAAKNFIEFCKNRKVHLA